MKMKRYIVTIYADYPENCTKEQISDDIKTAMNNQVILCEDIFLKRVEDTEEFKKKQEKERLQQKKDADEIAWHFSPYNPENDPNKLMWR